MNDSNFDDTDAFWNQKEIEEHEMWERHKKAVNYHKETLIKMNVLKENNSGHDAIQSK